MNILLYLFLISVLTEECYTRKFPIIAVIGGGIGGTSLSHFLRELFGPQGTHIDLYESGTIGGRLATIQISSREYEVGGSVIHQRNKYMVDFLKLLGLKKRHTRNSRFGLYDGDEFIFTESNWEIVNLVKLAWRYGYGPLKLQSYIDDLLKNFEKIYSLQANGKTFSSVPDLLSALSPQFKNYMNISSKAGFRKNGFSERIIDELITATLTANYGQSTDVHKFVGSVSVAGAGGGLWAVHGGNRIVPEMLLERSTATLINSQVTNITWRPENEDYIVDYINSNENSKNSSLYDIVILATPLTEDMPKNITFTNFPKHLIFPGRYHRTVCTVVEGKLNVGYFGFSSEKYILDEILTVKNNLIFNSIGRISPVDLKPIEETFDVWKVFSQVPLTESQLSNLFSEQKSVHVIDWLAYPQYYTDKRCDEFVLHKNLFHINAIEWAASAMEMSVIAAKNVALLAYQSWLGIQERDEKQTVKEEL